MTREQWLIYLYGIYPDKGFFGLVFVIGFLLVIARILSPLHTAILDSDCEKNYTCLHHTLYTVRNIVIFAVLLLLASLTPSKKVAVAIFAVPYGVDMLENNNSKITKLDEILDLSLDKVISNLKQADEIRNKK